MYPKKAPNRARIYVRFRAHVTVFCPGDGESRSAFDGPKTLIARRCQRDSAYGPYNRKIDSAPRPIGRRFDAGLTAFSYHSITAFSNKQKLRSQAPQFSISYFPVRPRWVRGVPSLHMGHSSGL